MTDIYIEVLLYASIGLTFFGIYSKQGIFHLIAVPLLFMLAINFGAISILPAVGFVAWALFNIYMAFFGGSY